MADPVVTASRVGPIFDPTSVRPFEPYVTSYPFLDVHALGVQPPRMKNDDGTLRPVQDWGRELSKDPMTAVQQVGAALWHGNGAAYSYLPYGNLENSRPSVNGGLAKGGGECDWFAAVGYEALIASGAFKKDDVMVGQVYANGGWHNVVFFKNPNTQKWDVLDYQNVVSVGGNTPEEAMRKYFRNHELGVLYRADDPNKKASIVTKVRSDHQATLNASLAQPGIDAAMAPSFGSTKGLNEGPGGVTPATGNGPGMTNSGLRMRAGELTVDGRVGLNGLDRAGIAYDHTMANGQVAGIKGLVVRDTSGEGVNLFIGGEWWSIQKNSYIGVVGGAEARFAIGTQRMKGEGTMTTIAPAASVQGGYNDDFVGDADSRVRWGWFVNGRFQIAAPLVLNQAGRDRVAHNSNGISAGGIIDPGFLGNVAINANAGTAVSLRITPKVTASASAVARVELQDYTLTGWPVALSGEFDAKLSYKGDKIDIEGGLSAGTGLYDRDILWRAYAGIGVSVAPNKVVNAQLSAGQFQSGEGFANGYLGVTKDVGPFTLSGGAGATVITAPGQDPRVVPSIGLTGHF